MTGPKPRPVADRFFAKVNMTSDCWEWIAGKSRNGYGMFYLDRLQSKALAHRVAYQNMVGPIPQGRELDHLCRNRACVRPEHLEPVTRRENLLRGTSWNGSKTHCYQGHEYTEANTWWGERENGRYRRCRMCMAEWSK